MKYPLAHDIENRTSFMERRLRTTNHEAQRRAGHTFRPSGHWRIQHLHTSIRRCARHSLGSLYLSPGTLYFFKGHQCVRRVTPIGRTRQPRLSAILCYNETPAVVFREETVVDVFNPSAEPYLGTTV